MKWYRFPGPVPFSKEQAAQFFGREYDAEQLYSQVMLNSCTVLVGKSGVGKSSLISAGLLPKIEKQINTRVADSRMVHPIQLVMQAYNASDGLTLSEKVKSLLVEQMLPLENEVAASFLSFLPQTERLSINFLLKQYQLQGHLNGKRELFLFIFDQLEQLYSYPIDQVEAFEEELREIINPNMPDKMRQHFETALYDNDQKLTSSEIAMLETPASVKFLFAIRSDRLSLLIRLRNAIPDLLSNPYELKPMDRNQATEAICVPAAFDDPAFITAPFNFHENAVKKICDFIENLPNNEIEYKFYKGKIEPIVIQILCRHIEEVISPYDKDRVLNAEEIDLQQILDSYYDKCIQSLQLSEQEEARVRYLIEEKLIYEADNRRLNFYEGVIKNEYKVASKVLSQLVEKGLLRCITTAGMDATFEIAHDWLVMPILNSNRKRKTDESKSLEKDKYLQRLNERIVQNQADTTLILERAEYYLSRDQNDLALADFNKVISMQDTVSPAILLRRSEAYRREKRYAESIEDLKQAALHGSSDPALKQCMGHDYYYSNELDLAKKWFIEALEEDKDNADLLNYLGIIALDQKMVELSVAYFKRVLEVDENYQYALYNLGVVSYNRKEFEAAQNYFEKALALPEENRFISNLSQCNNYLGLIEAQKTSQLKDGKPWFVKAVEMSADNHNAWYNLGKLAFDEENWDEALRCFAKVADTSGLFAESQNYLGRVYCESGFERRDYEKGMSHFVKACKANPQIDAYLYNLGWVAYQTNNLILAREYFEKAAILNPGHEESINYLGLITETKEGKEAAVDYYRKAAEALPSFWLLHYHYGRLLFETKKMDLAGAAFDTALLLKPKYADSLCYKGLIAKAKGDLKTACTWFDEAIEVEPQYYYPYLQKAIAHYDTQDYDSARGYFEKVLDLDQNNFEANNYLGLIAEFTSNYEKAAFYYRAAISIEPDNAVGHYNLGIASYELKDYEEAERQFTEAINRNFQPAVCYNYMGAMSYSRGAKDQAIERYKLSLQYLPDYEFALYNIGECYFDLGEFEEALKNFSTLKSQKPNDWLCTWFMARCYVKLKDTNAFMEAKDQLDSMEGKDEQKMKILLEEIGSQEA